MYTLELYKSDKRTAAGERLESKTDNIGVSGDKAMLELHFETVFPAPKYRIELHETLVTKKNRMTGKEFVERYDTPFHCSPSSEAFFSN
jgi:hypothetical protein